MTHTDEVSLEAIIEGAVFAANTPTSLKQLKTLFLEDDCPEEPAWQAALDALVEKYEKHTALTFKQTKNGYAFRVRAVLAPYIHRLWEEKPQRYSKALLETLAIIAYRQPITRGDVEAIRGVAVSSPIIRSLMDLGWIRTVGHREVPGRPALYATTATFLDHLGLKSLDELPSLTTLADLDASTEKLKAALGETHMPNEQPSIEEDMFETDTEDSEDPAESSVDTESVAVSEVSDGA